MTHRSLAARSQPVALFLVVLLVACGGGAAGEPSSADATPGTSSAAESQAEASAPAVPQASAGDSSGGDGGTATDVCALLSEEDLIELTTWGAETVEPGPQQGIFRDGCLWTLTDGSSAAIYGPATISLGVVSPGGRSYYDTYFAPFAEEYDQEHLTDVGDEGLADTFTNSVLAVQGDSFVSVQWLDFNSEANQLDIAKAIAQRALSSLTGG